MLTDSDAPAALRRLWPDRAATPLLEVPRLASRCGVAQVRVKDEGQRLLGNFKSLGGMYAGLRALARAAGLPDLGALLEREPRAAGLPTLLCASDGNHGLAVAAAAALAGAAARVYLPEDVSAARAQRIAARGAQVVRVPGTYDDAVREAAAASARGDGLLIADTSADPQDPVVADVMAGYGLLAHELEAQLETAGERPTHLFVQAGVGGLAAALAEGLSAQLAAPRAIVVVEPAAAACVARALAAGRPEPIRGRLETSASMLSCGLASAGAVAILLRHGARSLAVEEPWLAEAERAMPEAGGPATTASGAAGLAGLLAAAADPALRRSLQLGPEARVLLIATEGPLSAGAGDGGLP